MAIVKVTMLEGRPQETKERIIRGITDVLLAEIDPDPSHIRVMIEEIKAEHYAVGGQSLASKWTKN